jgi:hypothetical protein
MKAWFLRVAHPAIHRESVKAARLAPILFREVPFADLHVDMGAGEIVRVVSKFYKKQSPHVRGQYAGTLRRFLSDANFGDVVGIRVNKDPIMIFGRLGDGDLKLFPGLEKENVKGRPFELLTDNEQHKMLKTSALPDAVKSYRGTFCNWFETDQALPDHEIEIPDALEEQRRIVYSRRRANQRKQVKFIRVGADLGCGKRLSRIFADNHYQFIPIPQHNDPEFCRFTYGDVVSPESGNVRTKGRSLMNLRRGDMLVFYAGFDSEDEVTVRRLVGIFAFLVIKEAFVFIPAKMKAVRFSDRTREFDPFAELQKSNPKQSLETWNELELRYGNWNQHFDASGLKRWTNVIICGDRQQSRLLPKVEVLEKFDAATKRYTIRGETAKKWGLTEGHDLRMSPVRTADPEIADEVFERIVQLGTTRLGS